MDKSIEYIRKDRALGNTVFVAVLAFCAGVALMTLAIFFTAGAAHASPTVENNDVTATNLAFAKYVKRANVISQKHFGFDTLHSIVLSHGIIRVNIDARAFNYSKLSREKQVDIMIDNMTEGVEDTLKKLGVNGFNVYIDDMLFKQYKF